MHTPTLIRTMLGILMFLTVTNCSSDSGSSGSSKANSAKYFQTAPKVVIHVHYEAGAEPFVGNNAARPLWSIFEDNLTAIFQYRSVPPILAVPKTLAEMNLMSAQNRSSWTSADILTLHNQLGARTAPGTEAHFDVYFVKGYFNDGSGPQTSVIGVSIGGTTAIAIFKQVVTNTGGATVQKYVEQSTLVHEMGHALGFVNNGVPMASEHQDTAHGAHTTDSNCVMYWQNEGASDMAQFVLRFISSGSNIMWGADVLADARAYSR